MGNRLTVSGDIASLTPATHAAAVSPHDSSVLSGGATRALYIGTGGDLSVVTEGGETVLFVGVVAGSILPLRVTHVRSTGTSADDIVALW